MSDKKFEELLTRLESAVVKLEGCSNKGSKSGNDADVPAFVEEFQFVLEKVTKFIEASVKISTDVESLAKLVQSAFQALTDILKTAGLCKAPPKEKLPEIMKPVVEIISSAEQLEKKSKERDNINHLKAVCAMMSGLTWPAVLSKPHNFVKEMTDSGVFYSNKVLKDFKDKDIKHKEWVHALLDMFKELGLYVENFHPTGLTWNPKGSDAKPATTTTSVSQPTPTTSSLPKAQVNPGALFSALNQGSSVTSGLKKVDDSQKTHKNPNLRAGAVVTEKAAVASSSPVVTKAPVSKTAVFELQVKKWVVEYQKGEQVLTIDEGDLSYTLYMFNCQGTTVVVNKKINSITMEACNKCNLVLKAGIISSCEVINSKRCNIQADDVAPSVIIGNSDDVNVYLAEKTISTEVVTSKTTGINVLLMKEGSDLVELSIPEQYVSKVKDGKLVTEKADIV